MAESWPQARLHVLQNSGSRMLMLRVKILSARDRRWRNSGGGPGGRGEIIVGAAILKCECQCTDGLSDTQNGWGEGSFNTLRKWNPLSRPAQRKVCIDLPKKTAHDSSYLATVNQFFTCRIVFLKLLKLNIKARQDIPEFLTTALRSIALDKLPT